MSAKGVKRASPDADEEKNPLGDVDLSDEDAVKLQELQRSYRRVELGIGACPVSFPLPTDTKPARGGQSAARPRRCSPCTRSGARS